MTSPAPWESTNTCAASASSPMPTPKAPGSPAAGPWRASRAAFRPASCWDEIAEDTHPVIERVQAAGGIVHARTTTPEFSCAGYTQSRLWGVIRNCGTWSSLRAAPRAVRARRSRRVRRRSRPAPTSAARSASPPPSRARSATSRRTGEHRRWRRSTSTPTATTVRWRAPSGTVPCWRTSSRVPTRWTRSRCGPDSSCPSGSRASRACGWRSRSPSGTGRSIPRSRPTPARSRRRCARPGPSSRRWRSLSCGRM